METTAPAPIARTDEPSLFKWRCVWLLIGLLIGLLILVFFVSITSQSNYSGDYHDLGNAKSNVRTLETNLIRYRTMAGQLPSQSQGLQALVSKPEGEPAPRIWVQSMEVRALTDPWGEPYQYRIPGTHKPNGYDVFSKGPDKLEGTSDDIGNWD